MAIGERATSYLDMEMRDRVSYSSIHNRLSALRLSRNMTQKELAQSIGVLPSLIGGYECGSRNIKLNMAFVLSEFFHVTVNELMGIPSHQSLLGARPSYIITPELFDLSIDKDYFQIPLEAKKMGYDFPYRNLLALRTTIIEVDRSLMKRETNRKVPHLSRREVARIMGVMQKSLASWELGLHIPSPSCALSLAAFYGVTVNQLMGIPETAEQIQDKEGFLKGWNEFLPDDIKQIAIRIRDESRSGTLNGRELTMPKEMLFEPLCSTPPTSVSVVMIISKPYTRVLTELQKRLHTGFDVSIRAEEVLGALAKKGVVVLPLWQTKDRVCVRHPWSYFARAILRVCSELPQPTAFVLFGEYTQRKIASYINDGSAFNRIIRRPIIWDMDEEDNLFLDINRALEDMGAVPIAWNSIHAQPEGEDFILTPLPLHRPRKATQNEIGPQVDSSILRT